MKEIFEIILKIDNDKVSQNSLSDILKLIDKDTPKLLWKILWFEGMMPESNFNVVEFENQIKNSDSGVFTTLDELENLCNTAQIFEILIIGDFEESNLKRFENDEEMYKKCFVSIEMSDSSFWIVHTKNKEIQNELESSYLRK